MKERRGVVVFAAGFAPASYGHSQDRTVMDRLEDGNDLLVSTVGRRYEAPNALKVMMVRVSCTPEMVCTFSAMK
jgi:hypothetical protein